MTEKGQDGAIKIPVLDSYSLMEDVPQDSVESIQTYFAIVAKIQSIITESIKQENQHLYDQDLGILVSGIDSMILHAMLEASLGEMGQYDLTKSENIHTLIQKTAEQMEKAMSSMRKDSANDH